MLSCAAIIDFFLHVSGEAIAATTGAFVGAGAAFLLQKGRENHLKEEAHYAAIIQAQHAIMFMWQILENIKKSYLDKERDKPDRHRMLPYHWKIDRYVSINLDAITFLFGPGRREVPTKCFFSERAYLNAMDALEKRNQYYEKYMDGATVVDANTGLVAVADAIDSTKDFMLRRATAALDISVENGLALLYLAFVDLRKAAKVVFPDRNFLQESNLTEEHFRRETVQAANQKV